MADNFLAGRLRHQAGALIPAAQVYQVFEGLVVAQVVQIAEQQGHFAILVEIDKVKIAGDPC